MNLMQHVRVVSTLFLCVVSCGVAFEVPSFLEDISQISQRFKEKQKTLTGGTSLRSTVPRFASTPEECVRECHRRSRPKTCYYKFIVEQYSSMGGACNICTRNETNNCQCVMADGVDRTIYSINRMLPGPSIQVCYGDTVVVDVVNHMPGAILTIHFHGILQLGTPYSDGVPFVTQCPIIEGNEFRYNWRAVNPGTHFYHSHTGFQKIDGVLGSIIIRDGDDVHNRLHDFDKDVIMITDWMHTLANERFPGRRTGVIGQDPDNLLINGKGQFPGSSVITPLEVFVITPNKRHRFRMINACATTCPVQIFVEGHSLLVIATDGDAVEPISVDSIVSASAERFDFIIEGVKDSGAFWIQVKAIGLCVPFKIQQLAILQYSTGSEMPETLPPTYDNGLPPGKVLNPLDGNCNDPRDDAVCINELVNAEAVNLEIGKEPDVKLYIPFRFLTMTDEQLFIPNTYRKFMVAGGRVNLVALMDGISFEASSSPLLSQYEDCDKSRFCNDVHKPSDCGENCICTHIIRVPRNALVEVIIVDEIGVPNLSHPVHLHGYSFHVVGEGHLPNQDEKITLESAIEFDIQQKFSRNIQFAPKKDTLAVPTNGYAVIRFIADNPGFWLFHCHFMYHIAIGMELVFYVGELSDLPRVPKDFPKCGNFLPNF